MREMQLGNIQKLEYTKREQINTICSNILFSGHKIHKIALTSCVAGEGKSYLTMQIAMSFAERGYKVVLVDADLRRSVLSGSAKMTTEGPMTGLAHYLAGQVELPYVLFKTNIKNFYIIPEGRDIANPVPLINAGGFGTLISELEKMFDLVIVDTPPVGLVIDAAEMARYCDGIVFVVEHNKTHKKELAQAIQSISSSECPVLGVILNKVSFDGISKKYYNKTYYSHYGNDYYHREEDTAKK